MDKSAAIDQFRPSIFARHFRFNGDASLYRDAIRSPAIYRNLMWLLICFPSASALASDGNSCASNPAIQVAERFTDLPAEIRADLLIDGAIADVGGKFNATDFIIDDSLPSRRFVQAGFPENKWFIWIEHGGNSRHDDVLGYRRRNEGRSLSWYRAAEFQGAPCAAIGAFLAGVWTPLPNSHK